MPGAEATVEWPSGSVHATSWRHPAHETVPITRTGATAFLKGHCRLTHALPLSTKQRRWLLALVSMALLAWLSHFYLAAGQRAIAHPDSTDFYKFLLSAQRLKSGQSMYWLVPPRQRLGDPCHPGTPTEQARGQGNVPDGLLLDRDDPCLGPNLNPPIFMVLVRPLSALSFEQAWWTWTAASLACGVLGMALLVRTLVTDAGLRPLATLAGSAALFLYYPTLANASLGQVGTLLLPVLVLTWRAMRRNDAMWAGIWLGLIVSFKPFIAILWLGLLPQKQLRTFAVTGLTVVVLGLLSWTLFGTDMHRHYLMLASDVTWNGANWNAAWAGVTERFFSGQADSVLPQGSVQARAWAAGLSSLTLVLVAWRLHRTNHSTQQDADVLMALGLPTALLVSPLGWAYYFPMLALSWAILWQRTAALPETRSWRMGLLLPLALSMATIVMRSSPRPETPTVWWGIDSIYCYALLGLLALGLAAFRPQAAHRQ